ncbi:hypothetical protein J7T55_011331 [Diaporthe amygdali]|uniref:uncharacterized protein n=1 Tax=Phomopsis amygdali TaxID=1214568 RepID=UPI0022FF16DB|nr:uncharacterized protein J7T55_011331 [Diaporthe amygdali]KAJ0108840.1 hypothetical protein J7T55_011331 [Diaporthe amygdali]
MPTLPVRGTVYLLPGKQYRLDLAYTMLGLTGQIIATIPLAEMVRGSNPRPPTTRKKSPQNEDAARRAKRRAEEVAASLRPFKKQHAGGRNSNGHRDTAGTGS